MLTKKPCLLAWFGIGILLFHTNNVYACSCSGASLHGDKMSFYLSPNAKKQVIANSSTVELRQIEPGAAKQRFDIEIEPSSILINFTHNYKSNQSVRDVDTALHFEDINPQLPENSCMAYINGMYIQSNNPEATQLNAKSTFSNDKIKVVFSDNKQQTNSSSLGWNKGHWIKVNLAFGCSASLPTIPARNGMTWGYRGQTLPDGPANLVQVGCNSKTPWGPGQDGMCNPYEGETSCSAERHILCVSETKDIPRPPYTVNPGNENFTGWYPGAIKLSPLTKGELLTSLEAANNFCGSGWRIAEFHDGHWIKGMDTENHHTDSEPPWNLADANSSGGWNFHGQFEGSSNMLNKIKTERFWVYVKGQKANCWDAE